MSYPLQLTVAKQECATINSIQTDKSNSNKVINVYDSISNAYEFNLPTLEDQRCSIVTKSVIVLTKSHTSLSYGIKASAWQAS